MKVTPAICFLLFMLFTGCGAPSEYEAPYVSNYNSGRSASTSSGPELFVKPFGLPLTFYLNKNGFGVSFDATVVTPIGTFGARYSRQLQEKPRPFHVDQGQSISNHYNSNTAYQYHQVKKEESKTRLITITERDYIVQIKNPDGDYDLFKISSRANLTILIDGKAELNIRNNYLSIDNSDLGIAKIELQNVAPPDREFDIAVSPKAVNNSYPNRPTTASRPAPQTERKKVRPASDNSTSYSNTRDGLKQQKKDAKRTQQQIKENIRKQRKQNKLDEKAAKKKRKRDKKERRRSKRKH